MSVIRNITITAAAFCLAVVLGLTLVVPLIVFPGYCRQGRGRRFAFGAGGDDGTCHSVCAGRLWSGIAQERRDAGPVVSS